MSEDLTFDAFAQHLLALNPRDADKHQPLTEAELKASLKRAQGWRDDERPPPTVLVIQYPGAQHHALVTRVKALLASYEGSTELILIDVPGEALQVPRGLSDAAEIAVLQQLEQLAVKELPKAGKRASYEKIPHLKRAGFNPHHYKGKKR